MMNDCMIVQIALPNSNAYLDYRGALESWASSNTFIENYEIETGKSENGFFWEISFMTENTGQSWKSLENIINNYAPFNNANVSNFPHTIVVAQTNNSWDNYDEFYNTNNLKGETI